jgi:hypothetical protein
VVDQGQREGTLRAVQSARDIARAIIGGFEGAMLVARPYGDITRFRAAIRPLLAALVAGRSVDGPPSNGAVRASKRVALRRTH